eukprot:TRINITY_DN13135_c0_g1_i1.p1 TRINITY_DN13135_c0_g1~~TRINITY_DN13135_c0_g1_i1.p1  ORF type:complete len:1187 (-),score=148.44 TRINITY_DN13135_c0_g1_i1:235-3345(-)
MGDASCVALEGSECDINDDIIGPQVCSVPCSHSSCLLGTCEHTEWGFLCMNMTKDPDLIADAFTKCLLNSIDPYLAGSLREQVKSSPDYNSSLDFTTNFKFYLQDFQCLASDGLPWPSSASSSSECLAFPPWSSNYYCFLGSPHCDYLTQKKIPYANGQCSTTTSELLQVSFNRPNLCQLNIEETGIPDPAQNRSLCELLGGVWMGPDTFVFRPYGPCLKAGDAINGEISEDECYVDACIPNLGRNQTLCASYCYLTTEEEKCTATDDFNLTWVTWSNSSTCLVSGRGRVIGYDDCIHNGYSWFQGVTFLREQYNNPTECAKGICWQFDRIGPRTDIAPEDCNAKICSTCQGTEPGCYDKEICETQPSCTHITGCRLVEGVKEYLGNVYVTVWTPLGDIVPVSQEICEIGTNTLVSGWEGPLLTEEECLNWASVCYEVDYPRTEAYGHAKMPNGVNMRNLTECEKCGGSYRPFWQWKTGKMKAQQYLTKLIWRDGPHITYPKWERTWNKQKWADALQYARVLRFSTIYQSELLCKFGGEKEILTLTSCSCSSKKCESPLDDNIPQTPVALLSLCEGIESIFEVEDLSIVVEKEFSKTSDVQYTCEKLEIGMVPLDRLASEINRLSSLAIYSETALLKTNSNYLFNKQDPEVVVGQLISNGYSFVLHTNSSFSAFKVCFSSSNEVQWMLSSDMVSMNVASSEFPFTEFQILEYEVSVNETSTCMNIPVERDRTFFLVGLVANWQNLRFQDSWPVSELSLNIVVAILYFTLLCWGVFSLAARVIAEMIGARKQRLYAKIGLVMIITQCILRVIYFAGVPFGTFEDENLVLLFSDLPQLLFHGSVVLAGIMWNELADKTKQEKRNDRIIFISYIWIATLFIFFVALSIAFGSVSASSRITYTCASTDRNAITAAESVSLSYKAIFAFYSVSVTITFAYQAWTILFLLRESQEGVSVLFKTLLVTSLLAICGLLIQAGVSIYSAISTIGNTYKYVLIICCELLPTYALAFMYRYKTSFGFTSYFSSSRKQTSTLDNTSPD